ncbi:glutamate synthase family protein [Bernardetia litoralis DSM 6794]|uniref:Glutamate synthase family protein n=1 Tax=Bernardetia litoralis (strain ATCC 23117 / DSM 6794 / NBRC 15988 / NCIMB 1366 / Fx l1 / Sio-4) TaxID=880071 RepID=I4AKC8_BERLS|nr:FMN-binding glutamate synthase family protein [Bernardetia litoralis]AFM04413.1 glutamate synthase family protein [Bernardetia litoralis DSM 6794]
MKHVIIFITSIFCIIIVAYLLFFFPIYTLIGIFSLIISVGIYDLTQTKHTILRNFPVIGHFRYILEGIGPEIHQYFIESDTDGKPLNKNQRTYVYSRAKLENDNHPFGTEHDLQAEGTEWTAHSIYTTEKLKTPPRVKIGGKECTQPYEASLLNVSAMSYGSLSSRAIESLNLGAKEGGFYQNTGEGAISEYHKKGGDITYQVGTGYFGCRDIEGNFSDENFVKTVEYSSVKMIEIKLSQGAKPGHGGVLPAEKNTKEIAKIRGLKPHIVVKSPNSHKEFDSPEGLLKFVQRLRELSKGKPIGFKLCIGRKKEFEDICKAMLETGIRPDFITVDGAEGGTGAAPITFSDHVGMPWENALVFVDNTLKEHGLRDEIKIITSGKIIDGFDVFKALCLGADLCNSARAMMLAIGCIQALECHTNTCPTGVATSDPSKMRGLVVSQKYIRVKNYHEETLKDFLALFAAAGCNNLSELNRSLIFKQIQGKVISFAEHYPEVKQA